MSILQTDSADSFQGVPPYPLYKCLASSLVESIDSKAFCRSHCNLTLIPEGSSVKQKENERQKLIMDKGSKIVNVSYNVWYHSMSIRLRISELHYKFYKMSSFIRLWRLLSMNFMFRSLSFRS